MFSTPPAARRIRRHGRLAIVGALALTATTAIAGCASNKAAGGSPDGIGGTLRVSAQTGQPYLDVAAKAFEKLHPGVHVQLVESPSNTYQTTVRAQLAANHGPDVMWVWGGSGNAMATQILAKAGLLQDLTDRPWVSKIGETATSLVAYQGKTYALNAYENPTGVLYNTEMLKKLGVSVPTTFSALLTFCGDVSAKGIVPIALGNQTGYLNTETPLELANTLVYSQDPDFAKQVTSGQVTWTSSELWNTALKKSLEQYLQMRDAKCFEPNSTGFSDQAANQLVSSQKALGVNIIAPAIASVVKGNPNLKYDMFAIPATDNPDDTYLTVNTGAAYAVNKASPNLKTAIAFVDFLAADEQLAAASKANFGVPYTPTKSTVVQDEMKGVSDLYFAGKTALWQTNFWPNADVKQAMIAACQNLILGKATAQDVVDAVNKALAGA